MKELKQKTFLTVCGILTAILMVSLALINLQNYNREWESIRRNLRMLDDGGFFGHGPFELQKGRQTDATDTEEMPEKDTAPEDALPEDALPENTQPERKKGGNPEDIMIMDHEVYTVFLAQDGIDRIISHGNSSEDFDIEAVAEDIIHSERAGGESIGNLFWSAYAYHYKPGESMVVINLKEVTAKLRQFLLLSLLLFVILEAAVIFLSRLIARWIVSPAVMSFQKQKEFIADASHELKTPLAVIMASADELGREGATGEERKNYLENIRYESERMNRLILGLLELSRLEDGDLRSQHKEEDLSRLIEKTALVFEGVAFEQEVSIETDIEAGLHFCCNKDEMEKMLAALLDNAVKHSYKGTAICVRARKSKGKIQIGITNRGDPISPEDAQRIFERFYRADKARSRAESRYGLGLAIAKKIAQNHNGDIRAYSENGQTIFEITLTE